MSYRRISLDLSVAQVEPKQIINRDSRISEVFLNKASGVIALRFGADSDPIDIDAPISFKPNGSEQRNGLYATWAAQAGIIQVIYIAFSGGLNPELQ